MKQSSRSSERRACRRIHSPASGTHALTTGDLLCGEGGAHNHRSVHVRSKDAGNHQPAHLQALGWTASQQRPVDNEVLQTSTSLECHALQFMHCHVVPLSLRFLEGSFSSVSLPSESSYNKPGSRSAWKGGPQRPGDRRGRESAEEGGRTSFAAAAVDVPGGAVRRCLRQNSSSLSLPSASSPLLCLDSASHCDAGSSSRERGVSLRVAW